MADREGEERLRKGTRYFYLHWLWLRVRIRGDCRWSADDHCKRLARFLCERVSQEVHEPVASCFRHLVPLHHHYCRRYLPWTGASVKIYCYFDYHRPWLSCLILSCDCWSQHCRLGWRWVCWQLMTFQLSWPAPTAADLGLLVCVPHWWPAPCCGTSGPTFPSYDFSVGACSLLRFRLWYSFVCVIWSASCLFLVSVLLIRIWLLKVLLNPLFFSFKDVLLNDIVYSLTKNEWTQVSFLSNYNCTESRLWEHLLTEEKYHYQSMWEMDDVVNLQG